MVGGRARGMVRDMARGRAHDTPHKGGVGKMGGMVKIGKLGLGDCGASCDLSLSFSLSL